MDEFKPPRPKNQLGYIVIVAIVALVAVFFLQPMGQQIAGIFQTLTDAFSLSNH
jgi:Flp pilus assembly pilin Flp